MKIWIILSFLYLSRLCEVFLPFLYKAIDAIERIHYWLFAVNRHRIIEKI